MTHNEILDAQIPAAVGDKCVSCDAPATVLWPVTPMRTQAAYCAKCLEAAQFRLLVALGVAANK